MRLNSRAILSILFSLINASILNIKPQQIKDKARNSEDKNQKVSSDLISIDLNGRCDTLLASWRSEEQDDKLQPVFRFDRSRNSKLMPDIYFGGCFDLSKGLSRSFSRISSKLVWSLREVRSLTGCNINAQVEKGLYVRDDITASLGVNSDSGDQSVPLIQLKFSSLLPSLEIDMCAFLWKRLKLSATSKYIFDSDIPDYYYHSKVPNLEDNNDSWIPNFRLMSNGLMVCNSQVGLRSRQGSPTGFRISLRKRLTDWGTWMDTDWRSDSGLINFEYSTSNVEGDLYQSLSIESDLDENILRNARAIVSVESVTQVSSHR